jgi:hypothetical protein
MSAEFKYRITLDNGTIKEIKVRESSGWLSGTKYEIYEEGGWFFSSPQKIGEVSDLSGLKDKLSVFYGGIKKMEILD